MDEQRAIDLGTLVLTSKRLAFLGSVRTNSVDLGDLISLEHYTDGIAVHRERKQKTETYVLTRPLTIADGGGRGLPVFGPMMKTAIEIAKVMGAQVIAEYERLGRGVAEKPAARSPARRAGAAARP